MIATWHPVAHEPTLESVLETDLHGRRLRVERHCGECAWHWIVRSARGPEIARGVAADAHAAERAAEDEVYRVHVPVGDATGWWLDRSSRSGSGRV